MIFFFFFSSQWPNLAYLISGIGQIYFTYPSGEEIEYLIMKNVSYGLWTISERMSSLSLSSITLKPLFHKDGIF